MKMNHYIFSNNDNIVYNILVNKLMGNILKELKMKRFKVFYRLKYGRSWTYDHIVEAESEQEAREAWEKEQDERVAAGQPNRLIIKRIVAL